MRRSRSLAACVLAARLLAPAALSAAGEGTDAAAILKLPLGARPASLGGAFVPIAEGAEGAVHNPAGLSQLAAPEAHVSHHDLFAGMKAYVSAAGYPFRRRHKFGAHLILLDSGGIPLTREDAAGNLAAGSPAGEFSNKNMVLGASYAYAPTAEIALGGTLKHLRDSVGGPGGDTVTAQAVDAGALYRFGGLRLGGALLNLGDRLGGHTLPAAFQFGAAYERPVLGIPVLGAAQTRHPLYGGGLRHALGLEFRPLEHVVLGVGGRIGSEADSSQTAVTYGLGLSWKKIVLQFAMSPYGDLGSAAAFALTYRFFPPEKRR